MALAFFSSSGRISSARWGKLMDVILLSASAFLFSPLALNLNLRAYVNSTPSGFVSISPAPEPSTHDDSSMNNIHGSGSYSLSSIGASSGSSSGRSTMKTARICPLTDVLGR
ncbi:hypothetical protein Tco_1258397 [Tanacetum coccineum]